jgi:hypothetical protein
MNLLVNPTGRKDGFRGIDWVIEHNNLYIKRIFGSSGSNHTVDCMIDASPLIEVYKDTRHQFERMFCLTHKTSQHYPPKMKVTFKRLREYMEQEKVNDFIEGRQQGRALVNTVQAGMVKLIASVDKERARLVQQSKGQEQLRDEAAQSKANLESSQTRNEDSKRKESSEPDLSQELDLEEVENDNEQEHDEDELEAERVKDDGSLFVNEIFE